MGVILKDKKVEIIGKEELSSLTFGGDDYFIFRDLNTNMSKDYIEKALLHYQYLEKNVAIAFADDKYIFKEYSNCYNMVFNSLCYEKVLDKLLDNKNQIFEVYTI